MEADGGIVTLEQEIVKLTKKWYRYVNLDHHKDRDCHWYISKTYSYGDEPYYEAHHNGYIIDQWTSPKCNTEEMASTLLRDKIKKELNDGIIHLEEAINNDYALDWFGQTKEELKKIIKELK